MTAGPTASLEDAIKKLVREVKGEAQAEAGQSGQAATGDSGATEDARRD